MFKRSAEIHPPPPTSQLPSRRAFFSSKIAFFIFFKIFLAIVVYFLYIIYITKQRELKMKDSEVYKVIKSATSETERAPIGVTHLVNGQEVYTTLEDEDDYGFTENYFYIEQGHEGCDDFARIEIFYDDILSVEEA